MALGMDMMMKAIGIDPKEITETVRGYGKMIASFQTQLNRLEGKLDTLLAQRGENVSEQKQTASRSEQQSSNGIGTGHNPSPDPGAVANAGRNGQANGSVGNEGVR